MFIKVVHRRRPNEDGRWIEVETRLPLGWRWSEMLAALKHVTPDDCEIVQIHDTET